MIPVIYLILLTKEMSRLIEPSGGSVNDLEHVSYTI